MVEFSLHQTKCPPSLVSQWMHFIMNSFKAFYPRYKAAHSSNLNTLMHFIGSSLLLIFVVLAILLAKYWLVTIGILTAYILAGVGHARFEQNKSMRFSHPVFCILGAGFLYLEFWKHLLTKKPNHNA